MTTGQPACYLALALAPLARRSSIAATAHRLSPACSQLPSTTCLPTNCLFVCLSVWLYYLFFANEYCGRLYTWNRSDGLTRRDGQSSQKVSNCGSFRKTAFSMMNYITKCCTPYEARAATEHFDGEVIGYLCEIQRIQRSELTALTIEELLSPLLYWGAPGIVATAPVAAAGIPLQS